MWKFVDNRIIHGQQYVSILFFGSWITQSLHSVLTSFFICIQ